jgi:hypothetical protein
MHTIYAFKHNLSGEVCVTGFSCVAQAEKLRIRFQTMSIRSIVTMINRHLLILTADSIYRQPHLRPIESPQIFFFYLFIFLLSTHYTNHTPTRKKNVSRTTKTNVFLIFYPFADF